MRTRFALYSDGDERFVEIRDRLGEARDRRPTSASGSPGGSNRARLIGPHSPRTRASHLRSFDADRVKTIICRPVFRSGMNPARLIGDVLVALVSLAVVGILLWFLITQLFPGVL